MTRFAVKLIPVALAVLMSACATSPGPVAGADVAAARPISDRNPDTPAEARARAHVELGMAYLQVGRFDVALDEAAIALNNASGYAPAYHLKGLVYMFVDDPSQADENFRRALSQAPGDPEFNNSYGWYLCTRGREDEGLERLALASRNPYYRTPTRPFTNAGLCHLRRNNDAAALQQFQRAIEVDPSNGQALLQLASIAFRQNDMAAARAHLIRLHQQSEPTSESVWLGVRTERRLGNRDAEASYAAQLRGRFADSAEFQLLEQGKYE